MSDKIVAVIGHVDHGKTSLVKALTGTETDRLKEEQERGLSIALGFAHLASKDSICHLVDTPGHADFVRTTASGLSGADAILLVVSSVDGVAAQTRDYVKMARLFGLTQSVVALSQSDRASPGQIETTRTKVKALLVENDITDTAIVLCSAITGEGIESLRQSLSQLSGATVNLTRPIELYLPIDRVFTVAGAGTVVTGSLISGHLKTGCDVRISPSNQIANVRTLQVTGRERAIAAAGNRVAVNLRGLEPGKIETGDVLCSIGFHPPSSFLDIALTLTSNLSSHLKHLEQVQILFGTRTISARLRLLERVDTQKDAAMTFAQLQLAVPHVAYRGQRAVIRRPASGELVAGAIVLDPEGSKVTRNKPAHLAVLRAAFEQSPVKVADALARRDLGCVHLAELERLSGQSISTARQDLSANFNFDGGPFAFEKEAQAALENLLLEVLDGLHMDRPLRPYVPKQELYRAVSHAPMLLVLAAQKTLKDRGVLYEQGPNVWLARFSDMDAVSPDLRSRLEAAEAVLKARGITPENFRSEQVEDTEAADIEERLIWMGRALRLYNVGLKQSFTLHSEAVTVALTTLRATFRETQAFTTGEARETLQTNRKIIVPLLEHFDRLGVTCRHGDLRRIIACSRPEEV